MPAAIHVINFQSFNGYLAESIGATTYSFSLNLGVYVLGMPLIHRIPAKGNKLYPREYHCQFRSRLLKTLRQKEMDRQDTWFVRPDGSNLLECIADAKQLILSKGMEWFQQLSTLEQFLTELETRKLNAPTGLPNSPLANLSLAFILKSLGHQHRAELCLEAALSRGVLEEATIRKAFQT